jgi:hypothetical protein
MHIERALRGIAGAFVMASALLAVVHSPWWLAFTGFVGLNLFQSSFTNWCPMTWMLEKTGMPHCGAAAPAKQATGV